MDKVKRRGSFGHLAFTSIAIFSLASFGKSVHAQDTTAAQSSTAMEEIVVTAQRRSERTEDIPMSVQAISQQDLVKTGTVAYDDLDKISVGTQIARIGIFTQPAIRGISTSTVGPGQDNNVATYVDGFYQADQLSLSGDLVNIGDIEVLKGPQGALYGRNATGGAILINTLDPTSDYEAKVAGGWGRFNDRSGQLYMNTPFSSNVEFNLSLNYRQNEGYIHDVTGVYSEGYPSNTRDARYYSYGARAKLKFILTDNLDITFGYYYKYFSDNSPNAWYFSRYPLLPVPAGVGVDAVAQAVPNIFNDNFNSPTAKISYTTPIGTLTSHTSYARMDSSFLNNFNGSKVDLVDAGGIWQRDTFQETLDYNITAIPRLNLVTGADFLREGSPSTSFTSGFGQIENFVENELRTRSFALYADGTYSLTDRLFLSAGVRYTDDFKSLTSFFIFGPDTGHEVFPGPDGKTFVNFSPRVALRYEVAPDSNVYASFSRGFKSGTFNSNQSVAGPAPPPVQPETVTAYEVGFKTNRAPVRLETAAYYYDYKDLQVSSLLVQDGIITNLLNNAATARIYGAEATIDWAPVSRWNLEVAGAYNHARYVNFPDAAAGIVVNGLLTNGSQNFGGLPLPRAPDWTATAKSDYTVPVGASKVSLDLSLTYTSSYIINSDSYLPGTHDFLFQQGGYALANGSVTWTAPGDRWWASVYSNNMFNRRYAIYENFSVLGAFDQLNSPVIYGVRAGFKFL
jgi:iron complex outermembrane receptor protein